MFSQARNFKTPCSKISDNGYLNEDAYVYLRPICLFKPARGKLNRITRRGAKTNAQSDWDFASRAFWYS